MPVGIAGIQSTRMWPVSSSIPPWRLDSTFPRQSLLGQALLE